MKPTLKRLVASVVSIAMVATMGVSYAFADDTTTEALLNLYDHALADDGTHGDTNLEDMEYVHYEMSDIQSIFDGIESLADAKYSVSNLNLLTYYENELGMFSVKVSTSYQLSYLYYTQNPNTDNLVEYTHTATFYQEFINEYYSYMGSLMESSFGTQLLSELKSLSKDDGYYASKYLSLYEHYSSFLDNESISEEAQEIYSQITAKTNEYFTLIQTDISSVEVTFNGETTTYYELLKQYVRLYSSITSTYTSIDDVPTDTLDTYFALEDTLNATKVQYGVDNATIGQVYIDIVRLYNQFAQAQGYDSYIDLAYDYDPDEIAEISDYVKTEITPILSYYSSQASSNPTYRNVTVPAFSTTQAEDFAGEIVAQVGDEYSNVYDYLVSHDLLTLDDDYTYSQGYTAPLPEYSEALIYLTYDNEFYNWFTNGISHEFGHFVDWYENLDGFAQSSMATAENVSISFSYLCNDNLDAYFDEDTSNVLAIKGALGNTAVYLNKTLSMNDFEVYAFQNADSITTEDLDEKYLEIYEDYGLITDLISDLHYCKEYDWYVNDNQIYTQPFYMVDYALSGITALNVFGEYLDDPTTGLALFDSLYTNDYYYEDYYSMMESLGIDIYSDEYLENASNTLESYLSTKLSLLPKVGDINLDGTVDVMDLTLLKKYLLGVDISSESVEITNGDMNQDSTLNVLDLLTLKKTILGIA